MVAVRDLTKRYRGSGPSALGGVSFTVTAGQLFCLLGPNGAGKTTTVSILTTTLRATSGTARVAGWDLATQRPRVRASIGTVFQQPSVDVNLTAEENLRLHAVLYGLYPWRPTFASMPTAYRRRVADLVELLNLGKNVHQRVGQLSGGTRRKLEVVRSLMHRPRVLFLDEPTTGLDPQARRSLWEYLDGVRRDDGTTIVLTTHYLAEAESADQVCVLDGGRVVEEGTPAALKRRHSRSQLLLDAVDRPRLGRALPRLGLTPSGTGPFRVDLPEDASINQIIGSLRVSLTRVETVSPSLEETYLHLIQPGRPRR